jgi:formylglycine-generating enzyme required for sulfatase activity
METRNQTHPTPQQLAALALKRVKPQHVARLEAHVAACPTCAGFIQDTPRDTLAALLKSPNPADRLSEQSTPSLRDEATLDGRSPAPAAQEAGAESIPPTELWSADLPGKTLADEEIPQALREQTKYRILRLLGRGGMGSVYLAYHVRMARRVAIKVINQALVDHPEALQRFDQEIMAAASLDHTNVARAHDADEFGSLKVLVMEYIAGRSVEKFLAQRKRLSVVEACRIVRQALIGLQHAHERGMVHRDLKPQNLMLATDGKVKILDFGLAKVASERRQAQGLTRENALMGTPHYLAPEQALDAAKADIRADIYSLGCTLYCLLAGRPPFDYDTDVKVLVAHQNETARPLSEICPDVPQELSDLVMRMLAKDPAQRLQTPKEAAQALLPFAKGEAPSAGEGADPLAFLAGSTRVKTAGDTPVGTARAAGSATTGRVPPHGWRWGAVGVGVLVAFFFIAWAAGVFTIRTPEGTIVVENVPADVDVQVDGSQVRLSRAGEQVTVSAVSQGDHHLKLVRDGKEIWASDVKIDVAGQQVRVMYAPTGAPVPTETQAGGAPGARIDLLKFVDLKQDVIDGQWSFNADRSVLRCDSTEGGERISSQPTARIEIPYSPPQEYELRITFVVTKDADPPGGVTNVGCGGNRQFDWGFDWYSHGAGINVINGKNITARRQNPTGVWRKSRWITVGKTHTMTCKVFKDRLQTFFDGELVVNYPTDYHEFSVWKPHKHLSTLGLGAGGLTEYRSVELIEITGRGTPLRANSANDSAGKRAPQSGAQVETRAGGAQAGAHEQQHADERASADLLRPIAVSNPSFEATPLADGQFKAAPIPGWTTGTGDPAGVQNWTDKQYAGADDDSSGSPHSSIPDGRNSAISRGPAISQILSETLEANVRYELSIAIGHRADNARFPESYRIQLAAGGVVLAEDNNTLKPRPGEWLTSTVSYMVDNSHPQLGKPLEIRILTSNDTTGTGRVQANYDHVRLAKILRGTSAQVEGWSQERFPNAEIVAGDWRIDGEELVQSSLEGRELFMVFGNPAWAHYNLALEVKATSGRNGFDVYFNTRDRDNRRGFSLGAWGNTGHVLFSNYQGRRDDRQWEKGAIEHDVWHQVAIEVRGDECRCIVDGRTMFQNSDDRLGSGRVGLGSWATEVHFRNIKVTSEDGKTILWKGLPKLPGTQEQHPLPGDKQSKTQPAAPAGSGRPGRVRTNSLGMQLATIPAGAFEMGSQETRHRVRISRAFELGTHEVTRAQFAKFVEATGYRTDTEKYGKGTNSFHPDFKTTPREKPPADTWQRYSTYKRDDEPVVIVSWNDAQAFCEWLGHKEHRAYRLPSEAEWEYACRAGTTTKFSNGDDPEGLPQVANIADATLREGRELSQAIKASDGFKEWAPVGSFAPNAFGLYDMHGNVSEWCADWFGSDYYAHSPPDDPAGAASGVQRVTRGGNWWDGASDAASASRHAADPYYYNLIIGFRVACEVSVPAAPESPSATVSQQQLPEAQVFGANWTATDDELVHTPQRNVSTSVLFGDPEWTNYDYRLKARAVGGHQSLSIVFQAADKNHQKALVLGGWGNKSHGLVERQGRGEQPKIKRRGSVETGRWYDVHVRVRGRQFTCFVDGVDLFSDPNSTYDKGRVGVRCKGKVGTSAHFKDIEITDPDGNKLWSGIPKLTSETKVLEDDDEEMMDGDEAADTGEFTPLFNGKDLTGWKTHPSQPNGWAVKNGMIVGQGAELAYLYSEQDDFADVHVRAEVRINAKGNSGVHVRTPYGPTHPPERPKYTTGYEAAICSVDGLGAQTLTGGIYAAGPAVRVTEMLAPAGKWFTIEEIVRGNEVTVLVNGRQSAHYVDDKKLFARGYVALELHDAQTKVEFRKIEVKRLK